MNPASPTSLSGGVSEEHHTRTTPPAAPAPVPADKFVSRGMTRGRTQNASLMLVPTAQASHYAPPASSISTVTALRSATALKIEPAATALNAAELEPIPSPPPSTDVHQLRAEARMKGYTGDQCSNCNSMRMKVSGHCMVCEDCGTTTGCS